MKHSAGDSPEEAEVTGGPAEGWLGNWDNPQVGSLARIPGTKCSPELAGVEGSLVSELQCGAAHSMHSSIPFTLLSPAFLQTPLFLRADPAHLPGAERRSSLLKVCIHTDVCVLPRKGGRSLDSPSLWGIF